MDVQLERECAGTNYVQIFGSMCRAQKITYCKRGFIPVSEHVSIGKFQFLVCLKRLGFWNFSSEDFVKAYEHTHHKNKILSQLLIFEVIFHKLQIGFIKIL